MKDNTVSHVGERSLSACVDAIRVWAPLWVNPSTINTCGYGPFIVRTTQAVKEKAHGRVVVGENQAYNVVKRPVAPVCLGIMAFAVTVLGVQVTDAP